MPYTYEEVEGDDDDDDDKKKEKKREKVETSRVDSSQSSSLDLTDGIEWTPCLVVITSANKSKEQEQQSLTVERRRIAEEEQRQLTGENRDGTGRY